MAIAVRRPQYRLPVGRTVLFVFLVAGAVIWFLPVAWMLSTSLKPLNAVFKLPLEWVPPNPQWDNYVTAWNRYTFGRYLANSVFISVSVTVLHALLAGIAGFGFAKYKFLGRRVLFLAILATLMLPIEVVMVPTFLIVKNLGWLNSYQGLIVPAVVDAFGVFLMRQFMRRIPDALLEAARLDGASEILIFFKIVVPLSWTGLLTLAIFAWRESWDSFVWPFIIITQNDLRTLPLGLQRFQEDFVTTYNEMMAISTIAIIPLALVFLFFQRSFIEGIALTGIKD